MAEMILNRCLKNEYHTYLINYSTHKFHLNIIWFSFACQLFTFHFFSFLISKINRFNDSQFSCTISDFDLLQPKCYTLFINWNVLSNLFISNAVLLTVKMYFECSSEIYVHISTPASNSKNQTNDNILRMVISCRIGR